MEPQTRTLLAKSAADRGVLDAEQLDPAILGFHAQQAAEKLLKALLVEAGVSFPRTHDLDLLANLVASRDQTLPTLPLPLSDLMHFAVGFRYDELPAVEEPDVVQLRASVDTLRIHVETRVQALAATKGTPP